MCKKQDYVLFCAESIMAGYIIKKCFKCTLTKNTHTCFTLFRGRAFAKDLETVQSVDLSKARNLGEQLQPIRCELDSCKGCWEEALLRVDKICGNCKQGLCKNLGALVARECCMNSPNMFVNYIVTVILESSFLQMHFLHNKLIGALNNPVMMG